MVSSGSDGVICIGVIGGSEVDFVCGVVDLHHIEDLWRTWSCNRTDTCVFVKL